MKVFISALLLLSGCATAQSWDKCRSVASREIENRLHAKGFCGASNCYDENNRSLQELVVEQCGYQPSTSVDRQWLEEAGDTEMARRAVALLSPDDPAHTTIAEYDRKNAEKYAQRQTKNDVIVRSMQQELDLVDQEIVVSPMW